MKRENAYQKSARLPMSIAKFQALRPKIDEGIRAGLTLIEFLEYEGISREDWYKMKPKEFHWGHTQSRLNVKMKRGGKPEPKQKNPHQSKQSEYDRRYREKKKLKIEKENKRLERKTELEKLKTEVKEIRVTKQEDKVKILPVKEEDDDKIIVLIGNSNGMSKMLKKMFG